MALEDIAVVAADEVPSQVSNLFEPIVNVIGPILSTISWLLGGIFGLYLLLVFFRVYYDRKRVKLLQEIHKDVHFLREHAVATHLSVHELKKEKKVAAAGRNLGGRKKAKARKR